MTKREFLAKFSPRFRVALLAALKRSQGVDPLAKRASVALWIRQAAESGQIALVESGMDCDCVSYSGLVRMVPANTPALERAIDQAYANAEGAISLRVMRPSEAASIDYASRDLAAEAYENGHAHIVYA